MPTQLLGAGKLDSPLPALAGMQAAAISEAVQADADAILLLDSSLIPAAAGWPRTHAFPDLPPVSAARCTQLCLATWLLTWQA